MKSPTFGLSLSPSKLSIRYSNSKVTVLPGSTVNSWPTKKELLPGGLPASALSEIHFAVFSPAVVESSSGFHKPFRGTTSKLVLVLEIASSQSVWDTTLGHEAPNDVTIPSPAPLSKLID